MLKNLHIVRRFGPVGGMERYVWELSHALANLDIEIHILCEESLYTPNHDNIFIHTLGTTPAKPRWISELRFSHRVQQWVNNNTNHDFVIHSHVRTGVHHITTFHSTLFSHVRKKPWWKKISIRIAVWLYLEKRELCGKQVQVVLPNSDLMHDELKVEYPCIGNRLYPPAYPGVHPSDNKHLDKTNKQKEVILFIGQEWQRKGLHTAVQIVEKIKATRPAIEFWVLGPNPTDIQHLFKHWEKDYRLLGWQESAPFLPEANLLLHPAIAEPYGMAIAEAANTGVPVVISNQCGIANQVTNQSGQVINLNSPLHTWVTACIEELDRTSPVENITNSWLELAEQHVEIYSQIDLK